MLFNRDNNGIEELRQFIPVKMTQNFKTVEPFIQEAELIVKPYISIEQYAELEDWYMNEQSEENAALSTALQLCQKAIAFLCYFQGFDLLILKFSDSGIWKNKTKDQESPHLRQEINAKNKFKNTGYNTLDDLLEHLHNNLTVFAAFAGSGAYAVSKKYFINSAKAFSGIFNINNSHVLFMNSLQYQVQSEDFDIIPLIGRELFDELKLQALNNSLTDANKGLLEIIQKAVAYMSVYRGGYRFALQILEKEYSVLGSAASMGMDKFAAVDKDFLDEYIAGAKRNGQTYLHSMEGHLRKNISQFPLYEQSGAYSAESSVYSINNQGKKVILM